VVLDEVLDVVEQAGQVELDGLTSAAGGGVLAGDAGAALVQGLADGVPAPTEQEVGLTLPQAKGLHGIRHVAAACWPPGEGVGGSPNQVNHFGSKIHRTTSYPSAAGILELSLGKVIH